MGKNYFLVHSIKGGCGKSAVALLSALSLSDSNNKLNKTLLIDMDLAASATHKLYDFTAYSNPTGTESGIRSEIINHSSNDYKLSLNEFLNNEVYDIENLINQIEYKWNKKDSEILIDSKIDYIFANSSTSNPGRFRYNAGNTSSNYLDIGEFRKMSNYFLNLIYNAGYNHYIFDMPASSNEYSYFIFQQLYELKKKDTDNKLYLFLVTTDDKAHLETTKKYLMDIFEGKSKAPRYEKIFIVINEILSFTEGKIEEIKKDFIEFIKENNLVDIFEITGIIFNGFQESYYGFTHNVELTPLNNISSDELFNTINNLIKEGEDYV